MQVVLWFAIERSSFQMGDTGPIRKRRPWASREDSGVARAFVHISSDAVTPAVINEMRNRCKYPHLVITQKITDCEVISFHRRGKRLKVRGNLARQLVRHDQRERRRPFPWHKVRV
ncbi:hypothetical protein ASF87_00195 [Microbacterium sp. Leaf161]|nr:hypothetical protein ASF87_00195 [Microbacterium sp. Leaf161]